MNKKPKKNSLRELGLETWLNQRYALQGGYAQWRQMLTTGATNTELADHFGITVSQASIWRYEDAK